MEPSKELDILIRAKYPIIYIVSWEEARVTDAVQKVCDPLKRTLHTWSLTQGMKPPLSTRETALSPELEVLVQVKESPEFHVFLLKDYHPYLHDNRVVRLLRDVADSLRGAAKSLILMGPVLNLPPELEKDITILDFGLPTADEIGVLVDQAIQYTKKAGLEPDDRERLIHAAQGLTANEINDAFARSMVEFKSLDIAVIIEEKKQIIRKSGLLEYIPPEGKLSEVGGMEILKEWLAGRGDSFNERAKEFGLPSPRGVLLLGVQGCGKSMAAKAIASTWNLPMLRLDVGRIFGSLVGQSEENIRRAIAVAESVAPCVLWADELEKGFAGVSGKAVSDSGTTSRVFATFLTWMQEKTSPVFLVATANDVSALPPEMLRKGRFDEIFFIDLPDLDEREVIYTLHIKKRKRDPTKFNIKQLAKMSDGYNGAEIEQIVIAGLFRAFEANRELIEEDLEAETKALVPLSVMMSEEIDELRTWASLRTRPASRRAEKLKTVEEPVKRGLLKKLR